MSTRHIPGIHHITAIAADPQRNLDFYTRVLGLRLVKLTVNFDDPGTYHFYFGDGEGTPGSLLTFFPWPGATPGKIGSGQVAASAFSVRPDSIGFWASRLREHGVAPHDEETRFGDPVLRFVDPDGLPLELVGTGHDPRVPWQSSAVPVAHALRGFHSATLLEADLEETAALLAVMGFERTANEGDRVRYRASGEAAATIDLLRAPAAIRGRLGAGTVHHIAFRTPTDDQQGQWREDLAARGYQVTPIIDRMYFHSIYFREPGGVLFEIATDPPGFAVDERPEHLGERLTLPEFLEPHRSELEKRLPRLVRADVERPGQGHAYHAAD